MNSTNSMPVIPEEAPAAESAKRIGDLFAAAGFKVRYPMGVPVVAESLGLNFERRLQLLRLAEKHDVNLRIYAHAVVLAPRLS